MIALTIIATILMSLIGYVALTDKNQSILFHVLSLVTVGLHIVAFWMCYSVPESAATLPVAIVSTVVFGINFVFHSMKNTHKPTDDTDLLLILLLGLFVTAVWVPYAVG